MAESVIRILSDLHYGDRASTLTKLDAIAPLFEGADELVFNGDTLDTRPSRDPGANRDRRSDVESFLQRSGRPVTVLTGNHDPDISARHLVELADRRVFVTHGDVLFEDIVPWSRDAALARRLVDSELAALPDDLRPKLESRLIAFRRAAAAIPQRHQSEPDRMKHAISYLADTLWPPGRMLRVLRAWREAPSRAAALLREHALPARVFVMGHTHRLGVARTGGGIVVLNTGSFTPPGGAGVIDLRPGRIALRRVVRRRAAYRLGDTVAEFALADGSPAPTLGP